MKSKSYHIQRTIFGQTAQPSDSTRPSIPAFITRSQSTKRIRKHLSSRKLTRIMLMSIVRGTRRPSVSHSVDIQRNPPAQILQRSYYRRLCQNVFQSTSIKTTSACPRLTSECRHQLNDRSTMLKARLRWPSTGNYRVPVLRLGVH